MLRWTYKSKFCYCIATQTCIYVGEAELRTNGQTDGYSYYWIHPGGHLGWGLNYKQIRKFRKSCSLYFRPNWIVIDTSKYTNVLVLLTFSRYSLNNIGEVAVKQQRWNSKRDFKYMYIISQSYGDYNILVYNTLVSDLQPSSAIISQRIEDWKVMSKNAKTCWSQKGR